MKLIVAARALGVAETEGQYWDKDWGNGTAMIITIEWLSGVRDTWWGGGRGKGRGEFGSIARSILVLLGNDVRHSLKAPSFRFFTHTPNMKCFWCGMAGCVVIGGFYGEIAGYSEGREA